MSDRFKKRSEGLARRVLAWATGTLAGRAATGAVVLALAAIVLYPAVAGPAGIDVAVLLLVGAGSAGAGWFASNLRHPNGTPPALPRESAVDTEEILSLRAAVHTMQLGITITDLAGKIRYTNPAEAAMHGFEVEELIGRDSTLFSSESRPRSKPLSREQLDKFSSWSRETVNRRKDGTVFPVTLLSDAVRTPDGEVVGVVTTCEDITERRRAEEQLRESEERYAVAARGTNDILWDWNLVTNALYLSPRWDDLLGIALVESGESPERWLGRVHPDDLEDLQVQIAAHLQTASSHLTHQHRIIHSDGSDRWVLCRGFAVRDKQGNATRIAGSMTDITERKRMEDRLSYDAMHDGLTGLPNRTFFTKMVTRAIRRAERDLQKSYAVLFVDIDRLKSVNDAMGHSCGDGLLKVTAQRLEACVRPGDIVARLGGDEFTVLLEEVSSVDEVATAAERVVVALQQPCTILGQEVVSSASVGVAVSEPAYERAEEVIRDADLAMYRAKQRGKARYEIFDKELQAQALSELTLEMDLRRAVEQSEITIHYQPIVALDTGKISGLEALMRWNHPQRGTIYPKEFIGVAEEMGLIVSMGRLLLKEGCRRLSDWQQSFPVDPPLFLSVNISPRQLDEPGFVEDTLNIVRGAGLRPGDIRLEIAEGIALDLQEGRSDVIRRFMEAGMGVQIDDFGTGYSALSELQRLAFDTLKIDRAFVAQLAESEENLEVVRMIVTMAQTLGMSVIAEGVETDDQRRQLQGLDCRQGQGYLFSEPLDGDKVEALLAEQS